MASSNLAFFGGPSVLSPADLVEAPFLDEADAMTAADIVRSRRIEPVGGPHTTAFTKEWADFVAADYCRLTPSGTAALRLSLFAAGIRPGQEVLVPALTFHITAGVVPALGAEPVFVDIRPDTFEIDLDDARRKLSDRTTAIIAVHCHGLPCDMDAVTRFANDAGLTLIEDCAPAPGATFDGVHVGSWGRFAAWSWSKAKPLMAGGGGAATTNDPEAFAAAELFSNHGEHRAPTRPGHHRPYICSSTPSDNLRMTEFNAAIGRAQLRRLPDYLKTSRANATVVTRALHELPGIIPPLVPPDRESAWTYFRCVLNLAELDWTGSPAHARDNVIAALRAEEVPVGTWVLRGVDRHRAFRRRPDGTLRPVDPDWCPTTQHILDISLVLFPFPHMLQVQPPGTIRKVVTAIEKVFAPDAIRRLLSAPHRPLQIHPPLPPD